jgi:hypothetical protein
LRFIKFGVGLASALLVSVIAPAAAQAHALAPADSPQAETNDTTDTTDNTNGTCTPLKATHTRLIGADGQTVSESDFAAAQGQAAKEVTYTLPDGATMSTIIPPAGFLPQNSTPETARAFGFDVPGEPNGPALTSALQGKFKDYTSTVPSVPCIGAQPISSPMQPAAAGVEAKTDNSEESDPSFAVNSGNWGGFVAKGHSNYVQVYDDQNIPTYNTSCGGPGHDLVGSWIGLGGLNSQKLIQQGFASGSSASATNGAHLWYEYLNAQHPNPPVYIGSTTRTGDVISESMSYSAGTVTFHWYDRSNGQAWSDVRVSGLSSYYDGTTADFISEKPSGFKLRDFTPYQGFNGSGAKYGSTYANLFALPNTEVRLVNQSGGKLLSSTRVSSNNHAFTQKALLCS